MLTKDELPECPVATTVRLIGNKWKLLIIRNLLDEPQRFSELKKGIDGISQKVLSENLRALESDGIIDREVFDSVPPKVVYSLSEIGKSLLPIINAMGDFGNSYKNMIILIKRSGANFKIKNFSYLLALTQNMQYNTDRKLKRKRSL